jgi:hypothetical protein
MTFPNGRAVAGRRWRGGRLAGTITRSAGAGIALSVAALLWAPAALADNSTNRWTASVTPTSITEGTQGSFTVTVTDATVSTAHVTLVNVTIPSGFTAPAVGAVTQPAGAGFAATLTGNVVALNTTGVGLAPGQSVSVAITATAPQTPGIFTWGTAVQHTGGFALLGPAPTVTVNPPPPASLAITGQPSATQVNTAMSPAVVVDLFDSSGNIDTGYNGPVELTYAESPAGAPLPANNVVNASSGVATFSALTFSAVGFPYELQADIPGLTAPVSPPSQPFAIATEVNVTTCQPNQTCQSGTVTAQGTSASVLAAAAGSTDILTLTAGGYGPLSCTTIGGTITVTLANRAKTITMTLAKNLVQQSISEGASKFNICWGQPTPFTVLGGGTSISANGEQEGLLPDCTTGGPMPCVASRHKNNAGDEVVTVSAPLGDPRISW